MPHSARSGLAAACLSLALAACADPPAPWFREVARERGLEWAHVRAHQPRFWFPEIMGGGVGLLDYDGDGALDVYLVQSGDLDRPGPDDVNRLFRNLGGARFADVSARAGGADAGYGMGVACGDADGDGDTDLYVTNVGPNALLRNDAAVFHDATAAAGAGDPGWARAPPGWTRTPTATSTSSSPTTCAGRASARSSAARPRAAATTAAR